MADRNSEGIDWDGAHPGGDMADHDDEARARQRRRQFFVRACIFASLAAVAQASAALPPGPNNLACYWASLAVFGACVLSILLPWQRFPVGPSSSRPWSTSSRSAC